MRKNLKKSAMALAATTLVGALAVGGSLAYLTDNETATNTFTVGKVQIDLIEPGFEEPEDPLVPNEEVDKDPQIGNTGNNDAIVFMSVKVPTKSVTVVQDDGDKAGATQEMQDLYWFKTTGTAGTHANDWNTTDWVLLGEYLDEGTELQDSVDVKTATASHTYVFGYKGILAASDDPSSSFNKTNPLFKKVQLKNFIENEADEAKANIDIKAYAIQSSDILSGDTDIAANDISGGDAKDNLKAIYEVYVKQASTTGQADKTAATENMRDLKGENH